MPETALVTGASGGIGLELARLLAGDGCRLILVARALEPLQKTADDLRREYSVEVITIPCDLSTPDGPQALWSKVTRDHLDIDILVNNAGSAVFGSFATADIHAHLNVIQLNISALTYLTKQAIVTMITRGHGHVLNVASTAAFQPGPLMAVYYASKAYVLNFSEAVAAECEGTGVRVTTLCPGPVPTGFQARAQMPPRRLMKSPTVMHAATVARIGYSGMRRGKRVVIPGVLNRMIAFGTRLVPRKVVTAIVYRLQKTA